MKRSECRKCWASYWAVQLLQKGAKETHIFRSIFQITAMQDENRKSDNYKNTVIRIMTPCGRRRFTGRRFTEPRNIRTCRCKGEGRPIICQRRLATLMLNFVARWGWVVKATPLPAFPPGKRPGTHCTGGWVGLRARLGGCEQDKNLLPPGFESRTV
jgi:hypothetical protein